MAKRTPLQGPDDIEPNPLGLDPKKVTPVVRSLNQDLATMYTFYHQIKKHHWVVEGPEFKPLHEFLEEWADALEATTDAVAERITALGGYPVSGPAAQEEMSLVKMEPEGVFELRAMLDKDLADGTKILQTLRDHIAEAMEAGDFGTEELLKANLLSHEEMVHHLDHFLAETSLVAEIVK